MKFKTVAVPIMLGVILMTNLAHSAIRPTVTRVIALESDKETAIKLVNDDKDHEYLVQSWIEDQRGNDKNIPLILTPPLFKMGAGREGKLRMVILPGKIAQDRESVYWLWIQEIPPTSKSKENQLQIAVRTRLKVFIRPTTLTEKSADTLNKLAWSVTREGGKTWLVAKNPTQYYANFSTLSVTVRGNALPLSDKNVMVPAKSESKYALPAGAAGQTGVVNYSLINDFGGESPLQHRSLTF